MINSLRAFFKGFVYAAKGIAHCISTQRNMRFHLCAAVTVMLISGFYELSRSDYALLMMIFASVIGSEAMNTAVENAVDLVTDEKKPLAAAAKDCAAAAVLICSVFAAAAGIMLFGDIDILTNIFEYIVGNAVHGIVAVLYVILCILFIFKWK